MRPEYERLRKRARRRNSCKTPPPREALLQTLPLPKPSNPELAALAAEALEVLKEAKYVGNARIPRRLTKNQIALARLVVAALDPQGFDEAVAQLQQEMRKTTQPRKVTQAEKENWRLRFVVPRNLQQQVPIEERLYRVRHQHSSPEGLVVGIWREGKLHPADLLDGGDLEELSEDMPCPSRSKSLGDPELKNTLRLATPAEIDEFYAHQAQAWEALAKMVPGALYRTKSSFVFGDYRMPAHTQVIFVPRNRQPGDDFAVVVEPLRQKAKLDKLGRPHLPWGNHMPAARMLDCYGQSEFLCDPRQLEAVPYDETIWQRLVLPPADREDLLDALYREGAGQEQVYNRWGLSQRHKGNGLIILCQGPPGTGKTMTAEAIAGMLQRPLLTLQSWAARDEQFVERMFTTAAQWKLVVLIDEAEAFLGARQEGAMGQNGLIAVMLRQIERFAGVMVLTTNRDFEIDRAAKSRVHLRLKYLRPQMALRTQIWGHAVPTTMINQEELAKGLPQLAALELDGRQIDHAVARAASRAARLNQTLVTVTDLIEAGRATLCREDQAQGVGFRS